MIVSDHQKAQKELKAAAKNAHVSASRVARPEAQQADQAIASASGAKFLKTFKTQQVKGHKEASSCSTTMGRPRKKAT